MKLEILDENFQPLVLDARRVLVLADDGVTPLAVAFQYVRDEVAVGHFGDADFNVMLKRFGIKAAVTVQQLDKASLTQFKPLAT